MTTPLRPIPRRDRPGAKPESIITKVIPLEEITREGFEVLVRPAKEEIKILVEPNAQIA